MKKLIIPIILLLCLIGLVSATVTLDPYGVLANGSYHTSASVTYSINTSGNQSAWNCWLFTNENGTTGATDRLYWHAKYTGVSVTNGTAYNFTTVASVTDVTGVVYSWDVYCNATTDPVGDWGGPNVAGGLTFSGNNTMNYSVDATAPVITVDYPSDKTWYRINGSIRAGLTVIDINPAHCNLHTNMANDTNVTGTFILNYGNETYTNGTNFNFTEINSSQYWNETNYANYYVLKYTCWDVAGHHTNTTNVTFFMDSTIPNAFEFNMTGAFRTDHVILGNKSIATDYTPQVGWNKSFDLNFSRYEVYFYWIEYGNNTFSTVNNSNGGSFGNTSLNYASNISTLEANKVYKMLVTAYDIAGNGVNMSSSGSDWTYITTDVNRALTAGWNIIGNPGDTFNVSDLLSWTGATTVSQWLDNHTFESHTSGGSYATNNVTPGEPVLIYLSAAINFSDSVWNTTKVNVDASDVHNVTNETGSDWNLVMNKANDNVTFFRLDKYFNANGTGAVDLTGAPNVTYMSFYNNSASTGSKYISYVNNWSQSMSINATRIQYGECVWLYLGKEDIPKITLNWSAIES